MNTSLFKTSYTRSIISNPPAALPQIPTLAELRDRTEAVPIPIQPKPQSETRSDTLFSWNSMSIPKSFLPAYAVTGGPPPEYTASPIGRESWVRLGDELSMQGGKGRLDGFGMSSLSIVLVLIARSTA
jgi:hypothetical protein